jgi:hypothetical protein
LANLIDISDKDNKSTFEKRLSKIIQSANLNFLFGSGCSCPAIPPLGNKEKEIIEARKNGEDSKAQELLHDFLIPFLENTRLLTGNNTSSIQSVIENYQSLIQNIANILYDRKNNIIPSQATIFSTNYDLLLEYAMNDFNDYLLLCDGFKRTSNINKKYFFSSTEYFNTIFNIGNLYRYKVEIPTINLIKLHGSLNWQKVNNKITQDLSYLEEADRIKNSKKSDDIEKYNSLFNIILPYNSKFELTILEEIYYDLLRIYSNELDKESTVLITEGFSFADRHILEITLRALKNKTLKLIIFCYSEEDVKSVKNIFQSFRNVEIISNGGKNLDFILFNKVLSEIITSFEEDS